MALDYLIGLNWPDEKNSTVQMNCFRPKIAPSSCKGETGSTSLHPSPPIIFLLKQDQALTHS